MNYCTLSNCTNAYADSQRLSSANFLDGSCCSVKVDIIALASLSTRGLESAMKHLSDRRSTEEAVLSTDANKYRDIQQVCRGKE